MSDEEATTGVQLAERVFNKYPLVSGEIHNEGMLGDSDNDDAKPSAVKKPPLPAPAPPRPPKKSILRPDGVGMTVALNSHRPGRLMRETGPRSKKKEKRGGGQEQQSPPTPTSPPSPAVGKSMSLGSTRTLRFPFLDKRAQTQHLLPRKAVKKNMLLLLIIFLSSLVLVSACDPGTYCASEDWAGTNQCEDCPAGFYCPGQSSWNCWGTDPNSDDNAPKTECEAGTYASSGAASCTPCEAGTYASSGAASCIRVSHFWDFRGCSGDSVVDAAEGR